jgi:putative proteasome-type protease
VTPRFGRPEDAEMTYCAGILVDQGLVMIADTRTNAGVDNISQYRKLHTFERAGERALAICTAGNLSITQSALSLLREGRSSGGDSGEVETLSTVPTMFRAAQLVGWAVRKAVAEVKHELEEAGIDCNASFLFGGQISGEAPALYLVYSQGNFIQCSDDTHFLQIGEHKYGKPILDRAITGDMDLYDALKVGLISFDSTMRSNLSVGAPLDLCVIRRNDLHIELKHRIEADEPYFHNLRERWSNALRQAHLDIERPPYRPTGD